MNEEEATKYADIKPDGSILLGRHTVCDGANYGRKIGVFTHIHRDHTKLFDKAMHGCSAIFVTPPTLDMLAAMDQDPPTVSAECYFGGRHIHALDYGSPKRPKLDEFSQTSGYGDSITLYQSHHILGSCQVLVETDGLRIAYTGDFGRDAKPIKCDILVMDSTHGHPMFGAQADPENLGRRLAEDVDEEIQKSKRIIIRAHRGRLQEAMHLLGRQLPDEVRFLAHPTDIRLVPTYRKYGMGIRDCISYESEDGRDTQEGGSPYVEFRAHGSRKGFLEEDQEKTAVFNLGGTYLGRYTTLRKNGSYNLEFMDHADYGSIIDYVKKAEPQYVVTDYVRGRRGENLAEAIRETGIGAVARPMDAAG